MSIKYWARYKDGFLLFIAFPPCYHAPCIYLVKVAYNNCYLFKPSVMFWGHMFEWLYSCRLIAAPAMLWLIWDWLASPNSSPMDIHLHLGWLTSSSPAPPTTKEVCLFKPNSQWTCYLEQINIGILLWQFFLFYFIYYLQRFMSILCCCCFF